nr:phage major tail tube protein [Burkholderia gladioli]
MVPETLYNCSVAIDGRGYAGRATSMTPPKLKLKTDD